jgi:hypothetical protein
LDFKGLVSEYQTKIQSLKNDTEFYETLARFLSEFKDAHISSEVPSTYRANLGFLCDYIQGKVLIDTINRLRLPEVFFPFNKGDQLLAIGGVPVEKLMADISKTGTTGNDATNLRIAAARLTSRTESSGFAVPNGVTTVTVLPQGASDPVTVTATWIVTGSKIVDIDDLGSLLDSHAVVNSLSDATSVDELKQEIGKLSKFNMVLPQGLLQDLKYAGITDEGSNTSMFKLPDNAQVIPGLPVTAAIYEAAGKKIGILRIPSYEDDSLLDTLERAIMIMESQTDVLVLDQTNNPGGSVYLVSNIVSLFATKSYKDMNFALRPSMNWLEAFQGINTKLDQMLASNPNDVAANALKARFSYLESEVRDSIDQRRFLTTPVSLDYTGSFGMIQPAGAVTYTKPILLLVNELDASGGDAFPALMQDNGRATLFGATTMGAGGNVDEYGPLSNSYFKFRLTESLMVRPNGNYVENLGVTPDISYAITKDDFMNGYQDYVKAFTKAALKLVGVTEDPATNPGNGGGDTNGGTTKPAN